MKAWKMGAIVGAVIGLLNVTASVLFPIIGGVVGSVLFHSIYTFITTTKLKLWQKGGIVGAIWGLVTSLWWLMLSFVVQENELSIFSIPNILTFPGYATFMVYLWRYKKGYRLPQSEALFLFFIIALVLGSLIGILISYLIEKRSEGR